MASATVKPRAGGRATARKTPAPAAAPTLGHASKETAAPAPVERASLTIDSLQVAALDLFAQLNYSTVTIKNIAEVTGFNTSLIYYYFANKEELFLKAVEMTVEEAFNKFEAIRQRTQNPQEIIASWIEIHITEFVLLQKLAKVSLDYASTHTRTERIDRAIRKFYDKESIVLGRAIRDGIRIGVFLPVNAKQTAIFISTFLDGSLFRNVMFPDFNYKTAIRHMRTIVLEHLTSGSQMH